MDFPDPQHLQWRFGRRDVTCPNCHTAVFPHGGLCGACAYAQGQDILEIVRRTQSLTATRTAQAKARRSRGPA